MTLPPGYFGEVRPEMRAFLPQEYQRVLEIGCGKGAFSSALDKATETWGVEPNHEAALEAAKHLTRVLSGKFDNVADQIPHNYFDLIICNDVIEHMESHSRFLASAFERLRPDGYIVGSVPNVRNYRVLIQLLVHRDWRYQSYGVMDETHLRFFTEKSLRRSLDEKGFFVEELRGIGNSIQTRNDSLNFAKRMVFPLISALTLGAYQDIRYLQLAFRARKLTV